MLSFRVRLPVGMATLGNTSGSDGMSGPVGTPAPPLASRVFLLWPWVFTLSMLRAPAARAAVTYLIANPVRYRINIPAIATAENQARLDWPRGTTINAASSGPTAEPALPPT